MRCLLARKADSGPTPTMLVPASQFLVRFGAIPQMLARKWSIFVIVGFSCSLHHVNNRPCSSKGANCKLSMVVLNLFAFSALKTTPFLRFQSCQQQSAMRVVKCLAGMAAGRRIKLRSSFSSELESDCRCFVRSPCRTRHELSRRRRSQTGEGSEDSSRHRASARASRPTVTTTCYGRAHHARRTSLGDNGPPYLPRVGTDITHSHSLQF